MLSKKLSLLLLAKFISSMLMISSSQALSSVDSVSPEEQIFKYDEPGLEFSMMIPPHWLVQAGRAGYAAVLTPSAKAERIKLPGGLKADPTITVAATKKPIEINSETLDTYALEVEEKFKKINGRDTEFTIFQKNIVSDLPNGSSGLLYYVSYKTEGNEVGQAIFVTGNREARFRVTLSDHRMNFDRNLELYYPYMTSLKFKSQAASRKESPFPSDYLLWGVLVIVGGMVVGWVARMRRASEFRPSAVRKEPVRGSLGAQKKHTQSQNTTHPMSGVGDEVQETQFSRESASKSPESVSYSSFNSHRNSEQADPAFAAEDLSTPPESIPLSHVVDENSVPPQLKKKWKIKTSDVDAEEELRGRDENVKKYT